MTSHIQEILKHLGWEDGFQIPISNAANRQLEEEVARLTLQKVKAKTRLEAFTTKLENLESHLNYITQESEQTQNLITAHAQQLQSEESRVRINQAERDKYEQEIREHDKKITEVKDRQVSQKNLLEKNVRKLDKLKAETDWDTEAIKAWEESLQKRDDDNETIKKFSKQDERRYKELEAKRQILESEYATRKQAVEKMVCEMVNYERMLERTGKIMKQQVIERTALIQQWKDSVKILRQRDTDIDTTQERILELQEIIQKEQEKLEEHKQFYNDEVKSNNDLNHETQQLNFLNSKMRRELNELTQYIFLLHGSADAVRRTMINSAHQLEKQRKYKKDVSGDISKKQQRNINCRTALDNLRAKYEELKKQTLTTDERTKHLEKLLDNEQKQHTMLQADYENLQCNYMRAQHDLQEQISAGKVTGMDIYGVTNNINHLRKHNEDYRKVLGKRKEDAYELDFKIDEVQRKILINENVIHSDDTEILELKLLELDNKMMEHSEVKNLLRDQVNKISDDMRRLTTAIVTDQSQLSLLKDKLQHQNLSYEGGQKQLQALKKDIQTKQVEENILRLRVNQLNKAMKKEEKSIYTMQKFKLTLEQATQERLLEIGTNKEILSVKRRNLSEDNGRLKCDIAARLIKLDQFKKKYEIVLLSLGSDDEGQPMSVSHLKIKNAQEKFMLQQEGDELDAKIKRTEKEIVAMENTLKIMNVTNAAFRRSLGIVDEEGDEVNEMKTLENKLLLVNDRFRENRSLLSEKKQNLEEIQAILEDIEKKKIEAKDRLFDLEEEYIKIQNENKQKDQKLKRAENCLKVAQKKVSSKEREKYDRDLEIRQLRSANENVMHRLQEMTLCYQEVAPLITRYTLEYQIKLPEKRTLTLSSSTESARSLQTCSREKRLLESRNSKSDSSSRTSVVSKVELTFKM